MKKLKEKVLKTIILLTVVSSTLPFFCNDVYADTITSSNIIGINRVNVSSTHIKDTSVNVQGLGQITLSQFEYEYEVTVLLDDYYLGYINGSFSTSLNDVYWGTGEIYNRTATKQNMSYYVNGNSFTTSFTIIANMRNIQGGGNIDPTSSYSTTFSLNTSNVVKYQDISSLDQIIDILTDIKNNTDIELDYLNEINKYRQYNFPIESLSAITTMARNNDSKIHDFLQFSSWTYPVFQFNQNDTIMTFWSNNNQKFIIILYANQNMRRSVINNYISFDYGTFTATDISSSFYYNNSASRFIKLEYTNNSGAGHDIHLSYINSLVIDMVPIFISDFNSDNMYNVSSDFALNFGLSNQILNDLHIVAQGTQSSSQSSSNLEDNSDDFDDVAGDVYNLENSFNTGLNNSLQQIDTSFDVGNTFGSKFLLAADWVRVQFNTITASNPFGTILSFSLLLGVALLIIGKVLG